MNKILTLCVVHRHPEVLLGLKKRGFGAGKWNGFGGKVMQGESVEDAARREVREEAGIEVKDMVKSGVIHFEFRGNPEILEVHIFRSEKFAGVPTESDEMKPRWFHAQDLPFSEMWADDRHWMPLVLSGKTFSGKFWFDEQGSAIVRHELVESPAA